MDAVEFLTGVSRMCKSHLGGCNECELYKENGCFAIKTRKQVYKTIEIVEKWSKEHPEKTRQSEFLNEHPNSPVNPNDGILLLNPCALDLKLHNESRCFSLGCEACRIMYWSEEVK